MNLFIFIFRDYRSYLSEVGAVTVEERALMQSTHMVLCHIYHAINFNTLDILFYVILSFIILYNIFCDVLILSDSDDVGSLSWYSQVWMMWGHQWSYNHMKQHLALKVNSMVEDPSGSQHLELYQRIESSFTFRAARKYYIFTEYI